MFEAVDGFNFALKTPNLLELSLIGSAAAGSTTMLSSFSLPPALELLTLRPFNISLIALTSSDIDLLPRSLVSLDLKAKWNEATIFKHSRWPPSLTFLRLESARVLLDYLPRSLVTLDLSEVLYLETSFPSATDGLVFPWRVFFPLLTRLLLALHICIPLAPSLLLSSIVAPDAREIQSAENFIATLTSSSPVGGVEVEATPTKFPPFTIIGLPHAFYSHDDLSSLLHPVAAYIGETLFKVGDSLYDFATLKDCSRYLSASILFDYETENARSTLLGPKLEVEASTLPSMLKTLKCTTLLDHQAGKVAGLPSGSDLPKLTTLHLRDYHGTPTLSILPDTITDLQIAIKLPEEWDLIATRLVSLRSLSIMLETPLNCSAPLTPIKSCLSSILITFTQSSDAPSLFDPSKPRLSEFFSSPSPLPPTITKLLLKGENIHASILAVLPPRLLELNIEGLAWGDLPHEILTPFPAGANLSPDDLIKSLPSKLRIMSITGFRDANQQIVSTSCLRHLPRSLGSFTSSRLFTYTEFSGPETFNMFPASLCYIELSGKGVMTYQKIVGNEKNPSWRFLAGSRLTL